MGRRGETAQRGRERVAANRDAGCACWGFWLDCFASRRRCSRRRFSLVATLSIDSGLHVGVLVDAAQRNDAAEFQKRIDDDEIAKNMVANVSQKAAGRYGFALNSADSTARSMRDAVAVAAREANDSRRSRERDQGICFDVASRQPFIFLVARNPVAGEQ